MEITVYADILFATNFLMDTVILYFMSILTRTSLKILKIAFASAILALYGTVSFFPQFEFLTSLPFLLLVSAISISPFGIKSGFFKRYIVFHIVSVVLGGIIFAMVTRFNTPDIPSFAYDGKVYLDADLSVICWGIVLSYSLIFAVKKICVRNFSRDKILLPLSIVLWGKKYKLTALIDTGCEITLPITGEGVLLVSANILNISNLPEPYLNLHISTASGTDTIPVYYPEKVVCLSKHYKLQKIPPIGIVSTPLSKDGLYNSILNPIILFNTKPNKLRKEVLR